MKMGFISIMLPQNFVNREYLEIALILLNFTGAITSQFLNFAAEPILKGIANNLTELNKKSTIFAYLISAENR